MATDIDKKLRAEELKSSAVTLGTRVPIVRLGGGPREHRESRTQQHGVSSSHKCNLIHRLEARNQESPDGDSFQVFTRQYKPGKPPRPQSLRSLEFPLPATPPETFPRVPSVRKTRVPHSLLWQRIHFKSSHLSLRSGLQGGAPV